MSENEILMVEATITRDGNPVTTIEEAALAGNDLLSHAGYMTEGTNPEWGGFLMAMTPAEWGFVERGEGQFTRTGSPYKIVAEMP